MSRQRGVHGGERLDRVQLLHQHPAPGHPDRGDGVGEAGKQDQAFGDEGDDRGRRLGDRVAGGRLLGPERVSEQTSEGDDHRHEREQQPVHRALERRARVPERPGLPGDPGRVALVADRAHDERARALDRERAGADLVAGTPFDRVRLAGQDRLVEAETGRADERAVGDDLVAGLELDAVAHDDPVHRHATARAVAYDRAGRLHERGEPVERPLRPHLLEDPDRGVRDQHADEESVARVPEGDDEDAEHRQDQVEDGEDVGPDDAPVGAARLLLRRPGLRREALPGLGLAQAGVGRLGDGDGRRGHKRKATP